MVDNARPTAVELDAVLRAVAAKHSARLIIDDDLVLIDDGFPGGRSLAVGTLREFVAEVLTARSQLAGAR